MNWLKLLFMKDFLQNFWYNKEHCNGLLACTNCDEYNIVIYHDTWNRYRIITIFLISLSSIVIYQLSDISIIESFIFNKLFSITDHAISKKIQQFSIYLLLSILLVYMCERYSCDIQCNVKYFSISLCAICGQHSYQSL